MIPYILGGVGILMLGRAWYLSSSSSSIGGGGGGKKHTLYFHDTDDEALFTKKIDSIYETHGTDTLVCFPDTARGQARALFVSSLHGHHWNLTVYSHEERRENSGPTTCIVKRITNRKPGSALHIHLTDSSRRHLTDDEFGQILSYWKNTFDVDVWCHITLLDVNTTNASHLWEIITCALSSSHWEVGEGEGEDHLGYQPHSITVRIDSTPLAFEMGKSFRHHGLSNSIVHFVFSDDRNGSLDEIRTTSSRYDGYRPREPPFPAEKEEDGDDMYRL